MLEEDRVLGGDRAPGVRVCPDIDVPGHCGADPIQWQSYRPACVFGRVLCALWGTVFPGQGEQDTQRGQKGHCPVLGSCFGGLVLRLCRFGVIPPRKRVKQCRRRICAYPQKSAVGLRGQRKYFCRKSRLYYSIEEFPSPFIWGISMYITEFFAILSAFLLQRRRKFGILNSGFVSADADRKGYQAMAKQITVSPEELAAQQQFAHRVREYYRVGDRPSPLALVRTYGCQQNVSDSEHIKGLLADMGFGFTEDPAEADLVLFNTCAVREHAEDRVFGNIGALKSYKTRRPGMILGVCGCMVQQEHITEKLKKSYPYVDLIFGTHVLHRLPELLWQVLISGRRVSEIPDSAGVIAEGLPVYRDGGVKGWLPIMYGCNNFCSYCIVPYVRGRERSRDPEAVVEEARQMVAAGYKEITLLGQNVNSYGRYLDRIRTARRLVPDAAFTSDVIVGFPGETREDFEETLRLIREVEFVSLYTFIYSPREGTPAAKLPDPTPAETKTKWFREMTALQESIAAKRQASRVGTVHQALLESAADGIIEARLNDNTVVRVPGDAARLGQTVSVRITEAKNFVSFGEIVE